MNHSLEALVRFAGSHGDTFELLEFSEEVLDQMTPFVDFSVYFQRFGAPWVLRYDNLCAAFIHVFNDPVCIKRLVGDQAAEFDIPDQRGDAYSIKSLSRQQAEAHQITQGIGQGQDFGRQTAF